MVKTNKDKLNEVIQAINLIHVPDEGMDRVFAIIARRDTPIPWSGGRCMAHTYAIRPQGKRFIAFCNRPGCGHFVGLDFLRGKFAQCQICYGIIYITSEKLNDIIYKIEKLIAGRVPKDSIVFNVNCCEGLVKANSLTTSHSEVPKEDLTWLKEE